MELYECMQLLLGNKAALLCKTLEEEKNADVKLTEIAVSHINVDAAHERHKYYYVLHHLT
jgi:ferritin-like metal-binding protein YciE